MSKNCAHGCSVMQTRPVKAERRIPARLDLTILTRTLASRHDSSIRQPHLIDRTIRGQRSFLRSSLMPGMYFGVPRRAREVGPHSQTSCRAQRFRRVANFAFRVHFCHFDEAPDYFAVAPAELTMKIAEAQYSRGSRGGHFTADRTIPHGLRAAHPTTAPAEESAARRD